MIDVGAYLLLDIGFVGGCGEWTAGYASPRLIIKGMEQ